MIHTLHVHPRAYADIKNAVQSVQNWISESSADKLHEGLWAKIRSLANQPEIWPLADEADDLGIDLRQALFGRRRQVYRILYTVNGRTVNIHRVRHAAQDRLTSDDI